MTCAKAMQVIQSCKALKTGSKKGLCLLSSGSLARTSSAAENLAMTAGLRRGRRAAFWQQLSLVFTLKFLISELPIHL